MPSLFYNPYFEITSFLFLGAILIHFITSNSIWNLQNKIYVAFVLVAATNIGFDIATAYTISYAQMVPLWFNYLINTLYFLTQVCLTAFFLLYILLITKNIFGDKRKILLFFSPFIIFIAMTLFNNCCGLVFYFDSNYVYHHGIGFYFLFFCMLYVIASVLACVIKARKQLTSIQINTTVAYLSIIIIATIIQAVFPFLLISGLATTIALFSIYLTFQSPNIYIDRLTGILGRQAFIMLVDELFARKCDDKEIILVDITNLKKINSILGVYGGDAVVKDISDYLAETAPHRNSVYRLAGSVFAIIVDKGTSKFFDEKISKRLEANWQIFNTDIVLQKNICFISPNEIADNSEELLTIIESSLIILKGMGVNNRLSVDKKILEQINRRSLIEKNLNSGELQNRLTVFYQPVFSLKKKSFVAAEALLRMNSPELGAVSPDEFISVAEQSGLIVKLGMFVLNEVCELASKNKIWEYGISAIHINLSVIECIQPDIAAKIMAVTDKYPELLQHGFGINFEVTETVASNASEKITGLMKKLPPPLFSFSLDDYGRGYSNTDTIVDYPFDIVKIDKNMLYVTDESPKARCLYSGFSHAFIEMGLNLIAEGVETEEQLNFVKACGIDLIQGYYFSKPLSKNEFLKITEVENCMLQQS